MVQQQNLRKYWLAFAVVVVTSFLVLGWAGLRIYQEKPPIPDQVVTSDGRVIIGSGQITVGQNVWQAMGGMEQGSVWGHGSYVAPDWSADYLHREATYILDRWANESDGKPYDQLSDDQKAVYAARLKKLMRTNTYDASTNRLVLDPVRAEAFEANFNHYTEVYSKGDTRAAIPAGTLNNPEKLRQLTAFYFWSSWAASTNRPGEDISYTSNWPHESLVGNEPTSDAIIWTGFSIIMLLAGVGLLVWYHASQAKEPLAERIPGDDPLIAFKPTPSQKAVVKYFWVVSGLFLLQIVMGVIVAHYGVEGDGFYGIPLAQYLPYSVARTWHTQLGIFWIATAWLAAGLYIGPAVSGSEPKFQRFGVNFLFTALLVIVLGSMAGEWLSVKQKLSADASFMFGHQGYEYIDLGRFWQVFLLIGLVLWVFMVGRCIVAAIKQGGPQKPLMTMFLISSIAIGAFLHGRTDVRQEYTPFNSRVLAVVGGSPLGGRVL